MIFASAPAAERIVASRTSLPSCSPKPRTMPSSRSDRGLMPGKRADANDELAFSFGPSTLSFSGEWRSAMATDQRFPDRLRIAPDSRVDLASRDPRDTVGLADEAATKAETAELARAIDKLQDRLYA